MAGKAARLSEAHQFFTAQDAETQSADTDTTSERVIDLLNQAQLATSENKLSYLKQVQELIINKDPTLLDNFLDEILVFHQDRSSDVRRFVVGFVEEACKKDPILLTKAIGTLAYMLDDDNVNVMKRVMLACTSMYKVSLQLVCKQRTIKEDVNLMWQGMTELRKMLCGLVKSDNDGVRTHAIKFMEMLVLVHSLKSQDNDVPKKEGDVSLDIVPRNHPLVKLNELREEGSQTLESLLTLCGSPSISSVNLMAVLGTLSNIAKQRPIFMSTVVQAFESLHANLPPTLAKSQVSSVRKNLKMQLFSLLKHPAAIDYVPQIGTLLTDLGATQSELQKNLPKVTPEQLKRPRPTPAAEPSSSKKSKTEAKPEPSSSSTTSAVATLSKAADITTAELIPLLSKDVVTDLVLVSMLFLPKTMPSHFQETFTPIAAAGGKAQVAHLARLMATQMTNAGIGSGVEKVKQMAEEEARAKKEAEEKASREPKSIPVIGASAEPDEQEPIDSKKPFQSHPGFGVDQKETNSRSTQDSTSDTGRQSRQITAQPTDVPHLVPEGVYGNLNSAFSE